MVATTVSAALPRTTRLDMGGADTLNVTADGDFNVAGNAQTVRINTPHTGFGTFISNAGIIQNTNGAGGRAIRYESGIGTSLSSTINNSGTIQSQDDAIQLQNTVASGSLTLTNTGTIQSTGVGTAVDFGNVAAGSSFAVFITNSASGIIRAAFGDAVRFGGNGSVIQNAGTITGGSNGANTASTDGVQFEDGATGTIFNTGNGRIEGDRHGVNAGIGSTIIVNNGAVGDAGPVIIGYNGSGVGSDGNATITNHGTITGSFTTGLDINGSTPGQPNGGGPDGLFDGDGDGIDVDGQATIVNFGTIRGLGAGGTGSDGLPNTSEGIAAGGGTIDNRAGATISGVGLGILIDNSSQGNAPFLTTITNAGTIGATISFAIRIISNFDDTITNSGAIISGGPTAIQFGTGSNTLRILSGSSITGLSNGGDGFDTLDYSGFGSGMFVNLATGSAIGTGGVASFEGVNGSLQNDNIVGGSGVEILSGNGGNDTIRGAGGGDIIGGGAGRDTMVYSGNRSDYSMSVVNQFGNMQIQDTRGGSPDGTDTVGDTEIYAFANLLLSTMPSTDFDGDFTGDLLLRSQSTGALSFWSFLPGGAFEQSRSLGGMGSNITIVGDGDFNGDRVSDLLLRDASTGGISNWQIRNGAFVASVQLGGVGSNIETVGVGDFNGDGISDILLRDTLTGGVSAWLINSNNTFGSSVTLGGVGAGIRIEDVGDFNNDGTSDILLYSTTNGALSYWAISNGAFSFSRALGGFGSAIEIVTATDMTGDLVSDIVLRNRSTGAITYWALDGAGNFASSTQIGGVGGNFEAIDARDVDANGFADILLRNTSTNEISAFATDDGNYSGFLALGGAGADFLLA